MGGRIIHYGVDEYFRLQTLQNAGYLVQNCSSLSEFRWVLYSGGQTDVVAFTETVGKAPHTAMSLARSKRSQLVLFQGRTPHYEESDFNPVVPIFASPEQWLDDIASLIGRTHALIQRSSELKAKSRMLCQQVAREREKMILEFRRSQTERKRNREFKVDFLRADESRVESDFIPGTSWFLRSLGVDAMREFRSLLRISFCPAGTVLFAEGQLPREIYIVFTGNIRLSVNSRDGKRFIVHIADPGEMLGLASAFASSVHEVTAEASYPCDLGSVSSADFLHFIERYPPAFQAAAHELGRAYNRTCARLRTMGISYTVTSKLAGLLLEWSENGSQTERGTQIRMSLTHAEIGQCVGTTRESVTRTLHDLHQRRIIDQKGSMLTILDRDALETCAGMG